MLAIGCLARPRLAGYTRGLCTLANCNGHQFQSQENRSPGIGSQARSPGRQAERRQHGTAFQVPHGRQNVQKAVVAGDKSKAAELFKTAQAVIDSVADKGIFHKNKAARHKSRLSAKIKALAAR